jgi:Lrp/AsnC family transcriptional regulator for asnA, asnC and gidA
LDQIDRDLIDALRGDGRKTNKALARKLGIAESTVALRIRQLHNDRVMLVTLRRDLFSKGYDLQCHVDVSVKGRDIEAVAHDLGALECTSAVNIMLGSPEVYLTVRAVDRADLQRILAKEIAPIRGVSKIEVHVAVSIRKYQHGYAHLTDQ